MSYVVWCCLGYLWLFFAVWAFFLLSGDVLGCLGLFWAVCGCSGLSADVLGCLGLFWGVWGCFGLSAAVMCCLGLFWAVCCCSGLVLGLFLAACCFLELFVNVLMLVFLRFWHCFQQALQEPFRKLVSERFWGDLCYRKWPPRCSETQILKTCLTMNGKRVSL